MTKNEIIKACKATAKKLSEQFEVKVKVELKSDKPQSKKRYKEIYPLTSEALQELSRKYIELAGEALSNELPIDMELLQAATNQLNMKRGFGTGNDNAEYNAKDKELKEQLCIAIEIMDDLSTVMMGDAGKQELLEAKKRYDEKMPPVKQKLDELSREFCKLAGRELSQGRRVDIGLLRTAYLQVHNAR